MTYFLRRDLVSAGPHVNFLIDVHAGDYEENSWTSSSSCQQSPQSEYHSSLIFLDHLDAPYEWEGEGDDDEDEGAEGEEDSTDIRPLAADWGFLCLPTPGTPAPSSSLRRTGEMDNIHLPFNRKLKIKQISLFGGQIIPPTTHHINLFIRS